MLNAFRWSTIPQKQFIVIMNSSSSDCVCTAIVYNPRDIARIIANTETGNFATKVNGIQLLTILAKFSLLDVCPDPNYVCEPYQNTLLTLQQRISQTCSVGIFSFPDQQRFINVRVVDFISFSFGFIHNPMNHHEGNHL